MAVILLGLPLSSASENASLFNPRTVDRPSERGSGEREAGEARSPEVPCGEGRLHSLGL